MQTPKICLGKKFKIQRKQKMTFPTETVPWLQETFRNSSVFSFSG